MQNIDLGLIADGLWTIAFLILGIRLFVWLIRNPDVRGVHATLHIEREGDGEDQD